MIPVNHIESGDCLTYDVDSIAHVQKAWDVEPKKQWLFFDSTERC